jgi:hypothetical protein
MSEGEYYNIEKIIGRRKINGKFEYKIKWEGYPMNQCTWEPMKNLESAKELVEEYNRSNPIDLPQKSAKADHKKKDDTFLNKKRKEIKDENEEKVEKEEIKEENEKKNQENVPNEKKVDEDIKINDDNIKPNINEYINEKNNENTFIIDDSLKNVITVKQQNQKLMAVVNKLNENGELIKDYILTNELRRSNPWILLDFYESKIKFT